jgi:2-(1,2-epoxy-1,2-dihydrophenyl)acetyl-CoA isomerase
MATTTSPLLVQRDAGVMTLTLNRPERLNALTPPLLDELLAMLLEARDSDTIRAVVLTGAGRGFSAGADLRDASHTGKLDVRVRLRNHYAPVITTIRTMEKPVLAAVNGVAAGAGMSLALACDLRLAAHSARFIQAFVRIGLVPDAGSTFFLPRLVGLARAAEIAMLGDELSAEDALAVGLVNRVVPDDELPAVAAELAARLARGPRSIGLIKRALNLSLSSDLTSQLQHEEDLQALAAASEDFAEGVTAFLEKRPAHFRGR